MEERTQTHDTIHREMMDDFAREKRGEGYDVEIEVPYNYYGQAGFIDVILKDGEKLFVCELKPNLTNIGEAIRQVKKAEEFFLKAKKGYSHFKEVHYLLIVRANDENVDMCIQYKDMIREISVILWHTNKEKQAAANQEYHDALQGKTREGIRITGRKLCILCHKPIEHRTWGGMCKECWQVMK